MDNLQDIIEKSKTDGKVYLCDLMIVDGVTYSAVNKYDDTTELKNVSLKFLDGDSKLKRDSLRRFRWLMLTYVNHLERGGNGDK